MFVRISRPRVTWLGMLSLILSTPLCAGNFPFVGLSTTFNHSAVSADTLTFSVSLERALRFDPKVQIAGFDVESAIARERAVGAFLDPKFEVESEDLSSSGGELPIYTFSISQLVELGGKRSARREVALREQILALNTVNRALTDLRSVVRVRFAEAVAEQSGEHAAKASLELARTVVDVVANQVEAGERPSVDLTRAQIAFSEAEIEHRQAELSKTAAFYNLAALWGSEPEFSIVDEEQPILEVLDVAILLNQLEGSALSKTRDAELAIARSRFVVEKSLRIPDLTFSAGLRRYEATGSKTAVAKLSLVIPIFNGNRAAARAAQQQVFSAEAHRVDAGQRARGALIEAHRKASSRNLEVSTLKTDILPKAEAVADLIQEGYLEGKFSLLELLEAQKTLAHSRARYASAVKELQISAAELSRLIEPATTSTK